MDLSTIKDTVQTVFGVNILRPTRKRQYVSARAAYARLAREFTNLPLEDIGNYIKKDHASIVHYEHHFQWYPGDKEMFDKCREIIKSLIEIHETDLDDYLALSQKYLDLKTKHEKLLKSGHTDAEGHLLLTFRQLPDSKKLDVLRKAKATLKLHQIEAA